MDPGGLLFDLRFLNGLVEGLCIEVVMEYFGWVVS